MILIASREEAELLKRLRSIQSNEPDTVTALSADVIRLKTQIATLEINRDKMKENHNREDRELRHMIGLEKNRQQVEMAQATREAKLAVREENLANERKEFERQLAFNTERFQTMEKYMKDMFADVLGRLPNINVKVRV